MESSLKGKRILVTGAGQGIGNSLVKRLHSAGVHVIAVSRNLQSLETLKNECPDIEIIAVDLANWIDTRNALKFIKDLDGLVNNAAVAIIKPFDELSEKDFDDTFNVNIKGVFNVTQTLSKSLKSGSSVVNVSSIASTLSFMNHTAYSATKAAVDSLTRSLALEFGPRKIRFNSVNPTVILTKMGRDNWSDPEKAEPLLNRIPLHRFGEVSEVVDSIVYLLSENSSFVNGHHLLLEGGLSV